MRNLKTTHIQQLTSDTTINRAYTWLCQKRKNTSPNNDIWFLRRDWHKLKPRLQKQLRQGTYRFKPILRYKVYGDVRE